MDERDEATRDHDVVVVGGGVGGLVAALVAARAGAGRVTVVEPHPLGGRARVDERSGYRLNRGPRALYVGGAAERHLGALGIDATRGAAPGLRRPAVLLGGELHPMPSGAAGVARSSLFTLRQKARAATAMLPLVRGAAKVPAEVSVAEWLDHVRADGALRLLLEALVRVATYTDAPHELSAQAALANVHLATTNGVRYLDGGFQVLVDQLAQACASAGVRSLRGHATAVRSPEPGTTEPVEVEVDGAAHRARSVVLAVGGPDAVAALIGGRPDAWAPTVAATAACLELGVDRRPDRGFVLGLDQPLYLSLHCPPADLAPEGRALVHVMRYGATDAEADRAQLVDLAAQVGLDGHVEQSRFLASMTVTGGIPLAAHGGLAGRPGSAVPGHPGVLVAGDWVGPTGLLLDAVVASATQAGTHAATHSATMVAA